MPEVNTNPSSVPSDAPESVWTFRGYRMRPGEFNTAMVHFYRGEVHRSTTWRLRLDSTTNWAVVTTGAVLTFAFGSVENSHVVILISFLLTWLFLMIESRRTDKSEEVSQQLLAFLKRGVTALEGKGMYTGQTHTVLLCAVAPAEVAHLKSLVYQIDEHAFVVINPTEEIWGKGFSNLEPVWKRPLQRKKQAQSKGMGS